VGECEVLAGGDEGDQALSGWAGGLLAALGVLLSAWPAAAAPPAYCTGQRIADDAGAVVYPNGQRVVDGFGKQYYPNGNRVVSDLDGIRYSNGVRVRNGFGDPLFPGGAVVKSPSGEIRYPNGGRIRDGNGTCYYITGTEMSPCRRVVSISERLAGGETVFYDLDTVSGTIDLGNVRFEFPAGPNVIALSADLASGEVHRSTIDAVCGGVAPGR
jgi:hypothetical protein